jgi:hypothetical protein
MIEFAAIFKASGFFALFFLIYFLSFKHRNRQIAQQISFIRVKHAEDLLVEKQDVKCQTSTLGLKNQAFIFNKCNLLFLKNAFVIIGFRKIMKRKIYCSLFFIERNTVLGFGPVKRFNVNSFNGEVYIEFGEATFKTTNVTLQLKELTAEYKKLIMIA